MMTIYISTFSAYGSKPIDSYTAQATGTKSGNTSATNVDGFSQDTVISRVKTFFGASNSDIIYLNGNLIQGTESPVFLEDAILTVPRELVDAQSQAMREYEQLIVRPDTIVYTPAMEAERIARGEDLIRVTPILNINPGDEGNYWTTSAETPGAPTDEIRKAGAGVLTALLIPIAVLILIPVLIFGRR